MRCLIRSSFFNSLVFSVLLLAAAGCFTACETIPAGKPPKNNIVKPFRAPKAYQPSDAVNFMSTALTTASFQNLESGTRVYCDFESKLPEIKYLPVRVWRDSSRVSGLRTSRKSNNDIVLQSRIFQQRRFARWQMRLLRRGESKAETLWQQEIMVIL